MGRTVGLALDARTRVVCNVSKAVVAVIAGGTIVRRSESEVTASADSSVGEKTAVAVRSAGWRALHLAAVGVRYSEETDWMLEIAVARVAVSSSPSAIAGSVTNVRSRAASRAVSAAVGCTGAGSGARTGWN